MSFFIALKLISNSEFKYYRFILLKAIIYTHMNCTNTFFRGFLDATDLA